MDQKPAKKNTIISLDPRKAFEERQRKYAQEKMNIELYEVLPKRTELEIRIKQMIEIKDEFERKCDFVSSQENMSCPNCMLLKEIADELNSKIELLQMGCSEPTDI